MTDSIEGFEWLDFDELGSTNDEAKKYSRDILVVAKRQTNGRGRRGNVWQSGEGNLYFSISMEVGEAEAGQMPFAASLALLKAILFLQPDAVVALKWPNDVLLDGRKVSGILLERSGVDERRLVVGVGVNVASFPTFPLTLAATSLKNAGIETDSDEVLTLFMRFFAELRRLDFAEIRRQWLAHAHGLGQEITVNLPRESVRGVFRGLAGDGALELGLADGSVRKVYAGEIFFDRSG